MAEDKLSTKAKESILSMRNPMSSFMARMMAQKNASNQSTSQSTDISKNRGYAASNGVAFHGVTIQTQPFPSPPRPIRGNQFVGDWREADVCFDGAPAKRQIIMGAAYIYVDGERVYLE